MKRIAALLTVAFGILAASFAGAETSVKIRDLVEFEGVRGNDLVGYGLVVGLNGTGDSLRNAPYTEEALVNLLERLGVNVEGEQLRSKNVAAVLVTAELPPFARAGGRADATISAIGDAKSLLGGTLVMTPLRAADGNVYAVAQGAMIASGFSAEGDAESVVSGVPTTAVLPGGARIEREIGFDFAQMDRITLSLRNPDFTTAGRIEQAINNSFFGSVARMRDAGTVEVQVSASGAQSAAHMVAQIENLSVYAAQKARVVIDQRSGTIVLGANVKLSQVAVAQGGLTVRVTEQPQVAQPNPFAPGQTMMVPRTDIGIDDERENRLGIVNETATLADLVDGLNALGVGPRDMIDILKSIKTAGALHAELIVEQQPSQSRVKMTSILKKKLERRPKRRSSAVFSSATINEFASALRRDLSDFLSRNVTAYSDDVGLMRYGELVAQLPEGGVSALLSLPEQPAAGFVRIDAALMTAAIDAMLGIESEEGDLLPRKPSAVDDALLSDFVGRVVNLLSEQCQKQLTLPSEYNFSAGPVQHRSSALLVTPLGNDTITFALKVEIGSNGRAGTLQFCLPVATADALNALADEQPSVVNTGNSGWSTHMRQALQETEIDLVAIAHREKRKFAEIARWNVGDVLTLRNARIEEVEIEVRSDIASQPFSEGELGKVNGVRAVRITEAVRPEAVLAEIA